MPKKKKTAESINRQLMNTVRNKERGGWPYASNYDKKNSTKRTFWDGPLTKLPAGNKVKSSRLLNESIKKQSRAAKRASKSKSK